ncbi:MAG: arsenate reductase (glutaredoxin) [Candidatus Thiodiazotropha sp. DIVDIV]
MAVNHQERQLTMSIEIYHNPRCSKSRQTLQLLQEQGVEADIVEYLKTPPDEKTLEQILNMLGLEPRDLMRKKESEYKENQLDDPSLTRKQLIDAMIAHPKLIERPIVIKDGKAAIGRPPEKVLEIL